MGKQAFSEFIICEKKSCYPIKKKQFPHPLEILLFMIDLTGKSYENFYFFFFIGH